MVKKDDRTASLCQIFSKSLKPWRRYVSFRFSKIAAAAILNFRNFEILTVGRVKRAELRHRSKFRQNCSNCGQDVAIYRFFQNGGRPPSWICNACVETTQEGHLVVFVTVQKYGWNRCRSFDNMHVFRFREFGLKTPIHATKLGVGGLSLIHI